MASYRGQKAVSSKVSNPTGVESFIGGACAKLVTLITFLLRLSISSQESEFRHSMAAAIFSKGPELYFGKLREGQFLTAPAAQGYKDSR